MRANGAEVPGSDGTPEDGGTFTNAARRAQIIQAAIRTIAELGYTRASYARIARQAGLSSTGLISYHFASRDELIGAVVTEIYRAAAAVMNPAMDERSTQAGKLAAYIESNAEFIDTHRAHALAVLEIWTSFRTGDGKRLDEAAAGSEPPAELAALNPESLLRDGQRRGEFRAFDSHAMAVALRQAIDGAVLQASRNPGFDVHSYGRELVDLFDRATRAQP